MSAIRVPTVYCKGFLRECCFMRILKARYANIWTIGVSPPETLAWIWSIYQKGNRSDGLIKFFSEQRFLPNIFRKVESDGILSLFPVMTGWVPEIYWKVVIPMAWCKLLIRAHLRRFYINLNWSESRCTDLVQVISDINSPVFLWTRG